MGRQISTENGLDSISSLTPEVQTRVAHGKYEVGHHNEQAWTKRPVLVRLWKEV
jgi:hypothetical protein